MNLIIIDDDPLVVNSLEIITRTKGMNVLATGNTGQDAIDLYKRYQPDIVLLDILMEDMKGIEASNEILNYDKNANILLITTFDDEEYINKAIEIGCKGYILKENISKIIPAIEAIYSGNMVFDSSIILPTNKSAEKVKLKFSLSERELEVLEEISNGLSNKEISEKLFLSEGTIRNYISKLLEKLDLRDRTQLAIFYYKNI